MLLAMWIFASINATIKDIVADFHMIQLIFFRNFLALIPISFIINNSGGMRSLKTKDTKYFIILGCVGVVAFLGLFMSLKLLPLADAVTIHFSETLFITLLAPFVLKETIHFRRYVAVLVGFIGVVFIMRPTYNLINIGALYALLFAAFDGIAMLFIRFLTKNNSSTSIAFYYSLIISVISLLILPFFWRTPSSYEWLMLLFLGIGGGLGQICIVQSYRYAIASVVAPMIFTNLLWSVLYGYIFWDEQPDKILLIGAILIISSGLFIIWRENKKT